MLALINNYYITTDVDMNSKSSLNNLVKQGVIQPTAESPESPAEANTPGRQIRSWIERINETDIDPDLTDQHLADESELDHEHAAPVYDIDNTPMESIITSAIRMSDERHLNEVSTLNNLLLGTTPEGSRVSTGGSLQDLKTRLSDLKTQLKKAERAVNAAKGPAPLAVAEKRYARIKKGIEDLENAIEDAKKRGLGSEIGAATRAIPNPKRGSPGGRSLLKYLHSRFKLSPGLDVATVSKESGRGIWWDTFKTDPNNILLIKTARAFIAVKVNQKSFDSRVGKNSLMYDVVGFDNTGRIENLIIPDPELSDIRSDIEERLRNTMPGAKKDPSLDAQIDQQAKQEYDRELARVEALRKETINDDALPTIISARRGGLHDRPDPRNTNNLFDRIRAMADKLGPIQETYVITGSFDIDKKPERLKLRRRRIKDFLKKYSPGDVRDTNKSMAGVYPKDSPVSGLTRSSSTSDAYKVTARKREVALSFESEALKFFERAQTALPVMANIIEKNLEPLVNQATEENNTILMRSLENAFNFLNDLKEQNFYADAGTTALHPWLQESLFNAVDTFYRSAAPEKSKWERLSAGEAADVLNSLVVPANLNKRIERYDIQIKKLARELITARNEEGTPGYKGRPASEIESELNNVRGFREQEYSLFRNRPNQLKTLLSTVAKEIEDNIRQQLRS